MESISSWFTRPSAAPAPPAATELERIRSTHPKIYSYIVRLQQNDPTLTTLNFNLDSQQIGDRKASVLAKALAQNTTLSQLVLRYNQIGDAGASALANMLKVNRSLTRLNIESGKLSDNINSLIKRNKQFAPQLKQANQSYRDGQTHLAAQRYPEARQCFEAALKIDPEHPAAQAGLNNIPTFHPLALLQQNTSTQTQPSSVPPNPSDAIARLQGFVRQDAF